MAEEKKPFNKCLLYILIGLMVITGSVNSIFNKILQKLPSKGYLFEQHHWIITFGMFLGELVSIFPYIYIVFQRKKKAAEGGNAMLSKEEKENEEKEKEDKDKEEITKETEPAEHKKLPPVPTNLIFCITAGCDLLASTINTFGLTYLTTSMYQMMRGLELFFVCLWSRIFLKNPIYRHAYLGIGTLIFGLFLVGLNSIIFKKNDAQVAKDPLVGIILMCTSQFFSSTEYVFQEKFIKHYDVHPFQLVGFEGLWGSVMYSILLIFFQFLSDCNTWSQSIREGICFYYYDIHSIVFNGTHFTDHNTTISKIEDTDFAFKQMGASSAVLIVYIFYIVSIALYNIVGINLTKLVSSTARAVVDTVRTVFIWLFFLIWEVVPGTGERFYWLQLVGFLFLVFGTLVYNEIVTIPWFKLDYYTRDNIAKREKEKKALEEGQSPDEKERLYLSTDGKSSEANQNPPPE